MDGLDDAGSDYGPDFTADEEEILRGLLHGPPTVEVDNPIKDPSLQLQGNEDHDIPRTARLPPRSRYSLRSHTRMASDFEPESRGAQVSFALDEAILTNSRFIDSPRLQKLIKLKRVVESAESRAERERSVSIEAPLDPVPEAPDYRSPLQRFRKKPKKPLSVTDLISPSWCELQYWYTLTKHGKKRPTPAMRQGSAVHKTLEEQVHTTVAITDVQTKEDAWGLRVWNVIQGLRTLREEGMTREIEIWGDVDGQIVNGVIDELSYICPDPDLEAALEASQKTGPSTKQKDPSTLPPDQPTITQFLTSSRGTGTLESGGQSFLNQSSNGSIRDTASTPSDELRIYITDVKTRNAPSLPKGASFRPTQYQLMLYHRLLSSMALGEFDMSNVYKRYDLDIEKQFSEAFVQQMSDLDMDFSGPENANVYSTTDQVPAELTDSSKAQEDSTPFQRPTLATLTAQLTASLRLTFPNLPRSSNTSTSSTGTQPTLSPILTAEYHRPTLRNATTSSPDENDMENMTSSIIGTKSIPFSAPDLDAYLSSTMAWWRGERDPRGVCVEEAFKCGSCEFNEGCEWRAKKIGEQVERMRGRKREKGGKMNEEEANAARPGPGTEAGDGNGRRSHV